MSKCTGEVFFTEVPLKSTVGGVESTATKNCAPVHWTMSSVLFPVKIQTGSSCESLGAMFIRADESCGWFTGMISTPVVIQALFPTV